MSSVRSFAFLWRFWSLAAGTSTTVQEKRNIFRSFCTDLRKFLNFQMSEEKNLHQSKNYAFGLPLQDIISLYDARSERYAGGAGEGQFCRFVINSNLITAVMIDHFFDIL